MKQDSLRTAAPVDRTIGQPPENQVQGYPFD